MYIKTKSVVIKSTKFEEGFALAHKIVNLLKSEGLDIHLTSTLFSRTRELNFVATHPTLEGMFEEVNKLKAHAELDKLRDQMNEYVVEGSQQTKITVMGDPSHQYVEEYLTLL
jgi:hypothetical protein